MSLIDMAMNGNPFWARMSISQCGEDRIGLKYLIPMPIE
jgi:hypothetical protein